MNLNKKFLKYVEPALTQLQKRIGSDFVVFGSAPLYLLSVIDFNKTINDLDIAVKDESLIPKEAEKILFHNNPNQKIYKIKIDNINIDMGSCWKGQEDFFYKLFENPIKVGDFKFANLEVTEEWKKKMIERYNKEKDKIYLDKIRAYRKMIFQKKLEL